MCLLGIVLALECSGGGCVVVVEAETQVHVGTLRLRHPRKKHGADVSTAH